jgi:glucose-6-phosphate 1-dehydrogenase
VLGLVAMEPPSGDYDDAIPDKKLDLFKSIPAADPSLYVRGQYDGYRKVDGVASGSETETFVGLELEIDSWRWHDVPFFIRAGKALKTTVTELKVIFKQPPPLKVGPSHPPSPNHMDIRISPAPGARLRFWGKKPGQDAYDPEDLEVLFEKHAGEDPEPYERLLDDAVRGRTQLFTRWAELEQTWRIVQPLLDEPGPVHRYRKGGWGPKEAERLTRGVCQWYEPWLPDQELAKLYPPS